MVNQKSASNKSQQHLRHASMQGPSDIQGHSNKMTIQHRKNKSMLA